MYSLYKGKKGVYLIPIILFAGAIPVFIIAMIKRYSETGDGKETFIYCLCLLTVILPLILFINLYSSDPYKKLRSNPPERLRAIEYDFANAYNLCQNVYRGRYFYFFVGRTEFMVVPIGQLRQLSVSKYYSRSIGSYVEYKVVSDEYSGTVVTAMMGKDHDLAYNVAGQLCAESHIIM